MFLCTLPVLIDQRVRVGGEDKHECFGWALPVILKIFFFLPHSCENSHILRGGHWLWLGTWDTQILVSKELCLSSVNPESSWFEKTGRFHKTSLDTSPLARCLRLFLFRLAHLVEAFFIRKGIYPPEFSPTREWERTALVEVGVTRQRLSPPPIHYCATERKKKRLMGFVKRRKVNDSTITFVVVESKDVVWIFFRNGQRPRTHLDMWAGKISRVWCQFQSVPIVKVSVCQWK